MADEKPKVKVLKSKSTTVNVKKEPTIPGDSDLLKPLVKVKKEVDSSKGIPVTSTKVKKEDSTTVNDIKSNAVTKVVKVKDEEVRSSFGISKAKKKKKETEDEKDKRQRKVYDLPGQKHDPPEERDPLRIFYETLYEQRPASEMAAFWMMEHGLLSPDKAKKTFERKQKKQQQPKMGTPIKSSSVKEAQQNSENNVSANAVSKVSSISKKRKADLSDSESDSESDSDSDSDSDDDLIMPKKLRMSS
eukprot:Gb_08599 [translate_table: standard]